MNKPTSQTEGVVAEKIKVFFRNNIYFVISKSKNKGVSLSSYISVFINEDFCWDFILLNSLPSCKKPPYMYINIRLTKMFRYKSFTSQIKLLRTSGQQSLFWRSFLKHKTNFLRFSLLSDCQSVWWGWKLLKSQLSESKFSE